MGFGSRHCYVCDSENVNNYGQNGQYGFFEHMAGHVEDLKRFKFSNSTADACRTACKICGRMVQLQRMRWRKSYFSTIRLYLFEKICLSSPQRATRYNWKPACKLSKVLMSNVEVAHKVGAQDADHGVQEQVQHHHLWHPWKGELSSFVKKIIK